MDILKKTVVIIPAYKPDDRLPPYTEALREAGVGRIVVVDDGSGDGFGPVFDRTAANPIVHVIHYTPNKGKGEALRTAYRYVQTECPECEMIVTADADGQHKVEDVLRMVEAQTQHGDGLLLGSRDFSQPDVPPKSRMGNRITTVVFKLFYGQWVTDTQTGLRAFGRDLLQTMIDVKGDRYEYEMNVLIACAEKKIIMRPLTIETVYENNNEGSHFRPFQDSVRIYKVILGGFVKFMASSIISWLVDIIFFTLFSWLLKGRLDQYIEFGFVHFVLWIGIATAAARIISATVTYQLNKRVVFKRDQQKKNSTFRFVCVALLIMALSAVIVSTLSHALGWNETLIKVPVDLLLFIVSYNLQKNWVFREQ